VSELIKGVIKILRTMIKSISVILSIMILVLAPTVAMAVDSIINIDGYYEDWSDKPHTPLTHGNDNGQDVHSAALFLDGGRLYGHIKMNEVNGTKFQPTSMFLSVNNIKPTLHFIIHYKTDDNKIDWRGPIYDLPVGNTLGLGVFSNTNKTELLGDAAISISQDMDKKVDEIEFFIELESIREFFNDISVDEMQTFTTSYPNIGKEEITITGTSTAPYIGIVVALLVIGLVLLLRKNRHAVK